MDFPAVRLTVTQTRRHTDTYRSCDTDTDTCHRRATHVTLHGAASQQIIYDVIPQSRVTLPSELYIMPSLSHVSQCRVLPPGEFSVMSSYSHVLPPIELCVIPQQCVTMQGATTVQTICHVIPQTTVTLQGAVI